jgi:hypothetical protein
LVARVGRGRHGAGKALDEPDCGLIRQVRDRKGERVIQSKAAIRAGWSNALIRIDDRIAQIPQMLRRRQLNFTG